MFFGFRSHEMKLFIITGANRGIGSALAETFARHYESKARYLLVVRNSNSKDAIELSLANILGIQKINECVKFMYVDFGEKNNVSDYVNMLRRYVSFMRDCSEITLIVNHGTLVFKDSLGVEDLSAIDEYYQINVFSSWLFAAAVFRCIKEANIGRVKCVLVNISSAAALQANPTWILYSSTRAAKETIFRTIANEYPELKVLNYAPGACKTDMLDNAIINDPTLEKRLSRNNAEIIDAKDTSECLWSILDKGAFKSGDRIDYYAVQKEIK